MRNKAVVSGVLTAFVIGVISTLLSLYKESGILDAKVGNIEKTMGSVEKKIDDIHWFLIKKNNVKIERR